MDAFATSEILTRCWIVGFIGNVDSGTSLVLTNSGSDGGGCAVDTPDIRKREGGSAHVNHGGGTLLGRLRSHS
jgi:hypothetical protein